MTDFESTPDAIDRYQVRIQLVSGAAMLAGLAVYLIFRKRRRRLDPVHGVLLIMCGNPGPHKGCVHDPDAHWVPVSDPFDPRRSR